jgi:hypothetical protein
MSRFRVGVVMRSRLIVNQLNAFAGTGITLIGTSAAMKYF